MLLVADKLFFIAHPLQDLREDEAAIAKIIPILNALLEFLYLRIVPSVQEIDPDSCVQQDFHAMRPRRIAERFPDQRMLPLRARRPFCFSRRTSSCNA